MLSSLQMHKKNVEISEAINFITWVNFFEKRELFCTVIIMVHLELVIFYPVKVRHPCEHIK